MLTLLNKFKKIDFYFLGVSIFLIRLPPFYFFPIQSFLFLSHTLARLLILVLFSWIFLLLIYKKEKKQFPKIMQLLMIFWFVSQSISIVAANNIGAFLDGYKDIVFALLIFISTFFIVKKSNIDFFIKL